MIPPTKNKFQDSFFQSYLKNEISLGKQAAQICRKFDEMPKCLLPKINKVGTINPMIIPAVYQGQGSRKVSNMVFLSR